MFRDKSNTRCAREVQLKDKSFLREMFKNVNK